jgi:hypothetical protein
MRMPDEAATGEVQFTNLTGENVQIPKGTVVRTLGELTQRFATTRPGEAAAGPGETVKLSVEALAPGRQGNLPAGSLSAIEGLLGTRLSVANLRPTTGGKDRSDPAPSPADRQQLSDRLLASLRQTALQELQALLAPGDMLLAGSLKESQTLGEIFTPAQDQPSDQLSLDLQVEFEAQVVSGEDLLSLAAAVLDANLPAGYAPQTGSMQIETVIEPVLGEDPLARWELRASRRLLAELQPGQAAQLVLGLPVGGASPRLAGALPLDAPPDIRVTPSWWPRLPVVPFRVGVVILDGS